MKWKTDTPAKDCEVAPLQHNNLNLKGREHFLAYYLFNSENKRFYSLSTINIYHHIIYYCATNCLKFRSLKQFIVFHDCRFCPKNRSLIWLVIDADGPVGAEVGLLTEEPIHAPLCALDFSQEDGLDSQAESQE